MKKAMVIVGQMIMAAAGVAAFVAGLWLVSGQEFAW